MDIDTIRTAVEAAIQYFGMGRLCRLDAVFAHVDGSFFVRVRDTRKSRFSGPFFSFRIDVTKHSTPDAVREYTKAQFVEQFAKPSTDC